MLDQDVSPLIKVDVIEVRKHVPMSGMISQNKHIRFFDNSTLDYFRVCPRKFYFRNIRFFEPAGLRPPLHFGSAIHAGMDYIWEHPSEPVQARLAGAMTEFLKVWKESGMNTLDEFDIFPRTPGRALSIFEDYIERYIDQIKDCEVLGIEQPFLVPLSLDDETVFYIGKLDKVFKDRYGVQILDHKTASTISATWINSFSPNGQMDGYLHAGHTTYGEEFHGVVIDGILVNKTKTDFQRIPLQRQNSQLDAWAWEVADLIDMIELNEERLQEYRLMDKRMSYLPAFPKCTTSCTQYYGTCPYHDLCRFWDNPEHHDTPDGFIVHKWEPFRILENLDGTFRIQENERCD